MGQGWCWIIICLWHGTMAVTVPSLTSTLSESHVPSPGQCWPMLERGCDRLQGSASRPVIRCLLILTWDRQLISISHGLLVLIHPGTIHAIPRLETFREPWLRQAIIWESEQSQLQQFSPCLQHSLSSNIPMVFLMPRLHQTSSMLHSWAWVGPGVMECVSRSGHWTPVCAQQLHRSHHTPLSSSWWSSAWPGWSCAVPPSTRDSRPRTISGWVCVTKTIVWTVFRTRHISSRRINRYVTTLLLSAIYWSITAQSTENLDVRPVCLCIQCCIRSKVEPTLLAIHLNNQLFVCR